MGWEVGQESQMGESPEAGGLDGRGGGAGGLDGREPDGNRGDGERRAR